MIRRRKGAREDPHRMNAQREGTAGRTRPKRRLRLRHAIALTVLMLATQGCYSLRTLGMRKEVVVMEATAYCACKKCCEWKRRYGCFLLSPVYATGPHKGEKKKVGITADGSKARKGTIAADTRRYPFGTIMHVPGYGWGVVHDTGRAIKGNRIDLFFPSHKKALKWGRKKVRVKVYR